eukprot:scaffold23306_cov125-Isochrysis_galbana.AAC.12
MGEAKLRGRPASRLERGVLASAGKRTWRARQEVEHEVEDVRREVKVEGECGGAAKERAAAGLAARG